MTASARSGTERASNGLQRLPRRRAFIDALFPWFEPRTAPQGADALPDPAGATRRRANASEESGVRYIVWVTGDTERSPRVAAACPAPWRPGGGGCFGLAWWENDSSYEAAIWDIRDGKSAGDSQRGRPGHIRDPGDHHTRADHRPYPGGCLQRASLVNSRNSSVDSGPL